MNSKQTARFIFLSLLLSCSFPAFGMWWGAILDRTGINDLRQGYTAEIAQQEVRPVDNDDDAGQQEDNIVPPVQEPQEGPEFNEGDDQEGLELADAQEQQAVPENIDVQENAQKQAENNAAQAQPQQNDPADNNADVDGNNLDPVNSEVQENVVLQPNKLTFRKTLLVSGLISLSALCVYFLWQEYGDMVIPRKKEVKKKNSKEILEQEQVSDKKETAKLI